VYYDIASKRILPIEYDGNSSFEEPFKTSWTIFYREGNAQFPIMNILLKVPELRQRYLAHARTILNDYFTSGYGESLVQSYASMIEPHLGNVEDNSAKNTVMAGISNLKSYFGTRKDFLMQNAELNVSGLTISNVVYSVNNQDFQRPKSTDAVKITAHVSGTLGLGNVYLYYSNALYGGFKKVIMIGSNGDYMAIIPATAQGSYVRYYIEAVANNTAKTATYMPEGAEHDVYFYRVLFDEDTQNSVVVNEVMATNTFTVADQSGNYGDWIELYNNSDTAINLSGYYLTDSELIINKYKIPNGTVVEPKGYLIFWADNLNTSSSTERHTNFKLSADGEIVHLVSPTLEIVDKIDYGILSSDSAFARVPNGIGAFDIQQATFNATNNLNVVSIDGMVDDFISIYPNPSTYVMYLHSKQTLIENITIYDMTGVMVYNQTFDTDSVRVDVSSLMDGVYLLSVNGRNFRKVLVHR
jgi:hypothetical protein